MNFTKQILTNSNVWQDISGSEENVAHQVEMFYSVINNIILETVPVKRGRRTHHSKLPVLFNPHLRKKRNRKQKIT